MDEFQTSLDSTFELIALINELSHEWRGVGLSLRTRHALQIIAVNWQTIRRRCVLTNSIARPHRKTSITADLASLEFLLIISLIVVWGINWASLGTGVRNLNAPLLACQGRLSESARVKILSWNIDEKKERIGIPFSSLEIASN